MIVVKFHCDEESFICKQWRAETTGDLASGVRMAQRTHYGESLCPHKISRRTWHAPGGKARKQIDYILAPQFLIILVKFLIVQNLQWHWFNSVPFLELDEDGIAEYS